MQKKKAAVVNKENTDITVEDLKAVQTELKKYKGYWMEDIIAKLNEGKKKTDKQYNQAAVYNVFNGVVKNQIVRAEILKAAKELLKEYQDKINEVLEG